MNRGVTTDKAFEPRTFRRAVAIVGILAAVGSSFWAAKVTQAEFEVPLVDTTNFVPTSFQSIWVYNRHYGAQAGKGNDYEGFAVGKPTQSENGTTALYKFDGNKWVKMLPQGAKIFSPDYHLNAVSGQYLKQNGYAQIDLVGGKNSRTCSTAPTTSCTVNSDCPSSGLCQAGNQRQAFMMSWNNHPADQGAFKTTDPLSVGQVMLNHYNHPDHPLRINHQAGGLGYTDSTIPANSELYAVGRPDIDYIGANAITYTSLGGGMRGWLVKIRTELQNACLDTLRANTDQQCPGSGATGTLKFDQGSWQLFQIGSANAPTVNDNITGIYYTDEKTAYVSSSTFPLGADGQPKTPYERDCSGTQTSKLFRMINDPQAASSWSLLLTQTGECFYGLTATAVDVPSPGNGPLKTEIWIASSKGVRRLTDDGTNATSLVKDTTTDPNPDIVNRPVYGVASTYERSGSGQQLLLNGNFQSWITPTTLSAWHKYRGTASSHAIDADGTCIPPEMAQRIDLGGGNFAVQVEPQLLFSGINDTTCTGPVSQIQNTRVDYFSQDIPLTNFEGTRYRVSGRYKVTATAPPVASPYAATWNAAANRPTIRQGGVVLNCVGPVLPQKVNCPYSNFREMKTLTDANIGAPDPGFTNFSFEFTRAFKQINPSLTRDNGNGYPVSGEGVGLQIACVATFGARTVCDDFKVEIISEPALPATSVVKVFAVGQDGLVLRNDDGTGTPTTWSIDDTALQTPTAGSRVTLNSLVNAGGNHIFAAGTNTTLFRRSIGNVSGFAWLGAVQPGTTGLNSSSLGWVSLNCANLTEGSQSLCQRHPLSFGLSLEKSSSTSLFTLSGRAWLGKQISASGTNDDNEGLDVGTCEKPARLASIPAAQPYNVTGSCNTTSRTCTQDPTRACFSDFDCYGRCTGDQGYLCLSDNDCSAAKPQPPLPARTNSVLAGVPSYNLSCDGGDGSSPNACSAPGWLTLNASDLPTPVTPPSAPAFGVTLDQTTGGLGGWGRFMTLGNSSSTNYQPDQGWVKFRGAASNPAGTKLYGAQNCKGPYVLRCSNNPGNSCTVGNETLNCGNASAKCVNYSSCTFAYDQSLQSCRPPANTCTNFCGGNVAQPCTSDAECSSLWNSNESCKPIGYCANTPNAPTTTCLTNDDCSAPGSFCMLGAQCNVGAASSCNVYGVDYDESKGKFQGFAWSAEYGWVDFRAAQKGTNRFLLTRLGDVYSGGNIGSATTIASAQCNATYLVSAVGTISNFCTNLTDTGLANFSPTQNYVQPIPFSSGSNAFTNALGRFDLTGIETINTGVNPSCPTAVGVNKYCQTVTTITPYTTDGSYSLTYAGSPLDGASQIALNKTVYTANCAGSPTNTCTLTQALRIRNADPANNGAGILVVNGNLTITNNLQYVSTSIDDLRRLASLVVVVRGNLNIENQVSNLVGAYYVDGTVYTTPEADKDRPENRFPLTVRGLMMAKNFVFNRKFAGTVESPLPSELFVFDGRLQSNPLPGMVDFASALPNTFNSSP